MNTAQVIPFQFDTREVRTMLIDDQPWFVAADVSCALEYRIAGDMTRNLDDDEKGTQIVRTPGGDQEMLVINESGLYSAILRSRKAEAKRFKKWVTAEVLPAIRKHGRYDDEENKLNTLVGQTIGTDGFHCLAAVVDGKLRHLPAAARRRARGHLWSQVHKAFSVVSAEHIPASQLEAARNFIAAYALEGEWLGREEKPEALFSLDFERSQDLSLLLHYTDWLMHRWNSEIRDQGDPLLWMESIPYWETRGYVAIVTRNYWMYERQADAESPSRLALAQTRWPAFPDIGKSGNARIAANDTGGNAR